MSIPELHVPPSRQDPPGLCFIGFGEVTYHWVRTLIEAGYPRDALCVLYLDHGGRGSVATARSAELDVRLVHSSADVPRHVKIHIHATAPAVARRIFDACLPSLASGQIWVDVNSAGPITKSRMSDDAAPRGVDFVDGAIMAPAWKLGHRTPVWISGPGARGFAAWGEVWGTPTVFVGEHAGIAARVKMSRSVIVKGIAACLVEGLVLAEMNGLAGPVVESLRADFGSEVIDTLCKRLVPGTLRHGERRAMEMDGALELASECNWQPVTLRSTAALLSQVGALGSKDLPADSDNYAELLAALVAKIRQMA
jgi:3-hydroxyisobutyrate dehydrogenase